ncbi:MAG: hypothetical protein IPN51_12625 [Chloracidobacterium sp.]|nr:hypothetical protein [Chloracidobacterium sp.]
MKKKILLFASAILVFGLAIAVYALNTSVIEQTATQSCCGKGESCPMKGKHSASTDPASMHSNCDHKDGDAACPMMKDGAMADHAMKMEGKESCPMMKDGAMKDHSMKTDGMSADHPLMEGKESCPMMKDGAMKGHSMHGDAAKASGGKDGCPCCTKGMESKTTPAV